MQRSHYSSVPCDVIVPGSVDEPAFANDVVHVDAGAHDEEGALFGDPVEAREVQIAAIEYEDGAGRERLLPRDGDLMVLAFQTDVTRVATFSLGGEGDAISIPEIGITESRHQLSHHGGDAGYMEKLTNYDAFAIEQFSYFLTRLAETKDLNGKPLLGSTMALFGSGMSYGHSHGNANLPLILAGGGALGLKHGRHVDYNSAGRKGGYKYELDAPGRHYAICHRPVNARAHLSNLLLTVAQKMDVRAETFADSNGTVSEVLA